MKKVSIMIETFFIPRKGLEIPKKLSKIFGNKKAFHKRKLRLFTPP